MTLRRGGFTLIEMLGVIVIMALLSGTATVLLTGSRHRADMAAAIEQIQFADSSVRTFARRNDRPAEFSVSLTDGTLARSTGTESSTLSTLPGDVKIERVRVGDGATDFGLEKIPVDSRGGTPSYAVELRGPVDARQWIFFSGLTGQMQKVDDEELESIFLLSSGPATPVGNDAR